MDIINRGREYFSASYKRLAALLIIGGLLLAVPLTMSVVNNQQDVRQRASEPTGPLKTDDVTISSPTVTTNGTTKYQITVTSTDTGGGDNISRQAFLINNDGVHHGDYRGLVAWSSIGFTPWANNFKPGTVPLRCFLPSSGGSFAAGEAAIFNGYNPDSINLAGCYVNVTGNTRSVKFDIQFNPSYTSPINDNTLSGYSENKQNVIDSWRAFSTFSVASAITPTITPSPTPTPTTPVTTGAVVGLSLKLNGIGPNRNVVHPQRTVFVSFHGTSAEDTGSTVTSVSYASSSGLFTGTANAPFTTGNYAVKVKVPGSLWKQIPGVVTLSSASATMTPTITLDMGDSNSDNEISLEDYTKMVSCLKNIHCVNYMDE